MGRPIIRFVDWHGNRYYQYRGYTMRFGQQAEWIDAAIEIDKFIRTGRNPTSQLDRASPQCADSVLTPRN